MNQQTWWELHLRKARGETLPDEDERAYQAELARQEEQAPPLPIDLAALKQLHEEFLTLSRENHGLQSRLAELENEIRRVEQQLSRETRQAIGITE
jgi:predicted  nucleic acid-binding Zn-ribbon protein